MASKVKTVGVLTSGGDAPGMNAAIRAVVRDIAGALGVCGDERTLRRRRKLRRGGDSRDFAGRYVGAAFQCRCDCRLLGASGLCPARVMATLEAAEGVLV